jgi:GT2 family glycosyltransferase
VADGDPVSSPKRTLEAATPNAPTVSVIICAYTTNRWDLLVDSVSSVLDQTLPPREVFVCIDHNPELYRRAQAHWRSHSRVRVIENRYGGRLGSARTTAAELASGSLIAFLDDDAAAEPDWLRTLVAAMADPSVVATGGAPLPIFSRPRPRWIPLECDWVFGCAYRGLPESTAPVRHVIGASMCVRREELHAIGYFHSDDHDDMDMCHRLLHNYADRQILYVPDAVVHHYVHPERLTWSYFWRRCFSVNRGKVGAFAGMGAARNLRAERQFVRRSLRTGVYAGFKEWGSGDVGGLWRALSLVAGIVLAAVGYGFGHVELAGRRLIGGVPLSPPSPDEKR